MRYEAKVDRSAGSDACHPWTASLTSKGYAQMKVGDRKVEMHRWAYKRFVDPELRDDEVVRHTCDNPPCQNPKHWLKGTHADNARDKVERGRSGKQTHCHRGHDLKEYGYMRPDRPGQRDCRLCINLGSQRYYQRTGGRGRWQPLPTELV